MIPERKEICRKCKRLPSIHHLDYPFCWQPIGPINEEEYQLSGLKPDELVTPEGYRKMMDISMMDYCKNMMLNSADFIGWLYGGSEVLW